MLKLDIGCGAHKRPQFLGVDVVTELGVDVRCDIAVERLPFEDRSAEYIYSAHCLEHILHGHLLHVFQEMTRVCADGGIIEIWHPHFSHSEACVFGHVNFLSEALYDHFGCTYRTNWARHFSGAQWILEEVRYGVDKFVIEDMQNVGIDIDFAVSYFREVVREIGLFIRVDRSGVSAPADYRRSVCVWDDRTTLFCSLSRGPRRTPLTKRRQAAIMKNE